MPKPEQDTPPVESEVEEDTGANAIREFEDAVTAVTEERKLSENVRRDLEFREEVRKHLTRRVSEEDDD